MRSQYVAVSVLLALGMGVSGCAKKEEVAPEALSISGQLSAVQGGAGARMSSVFKVEEDVLEAAQGSRFASLLSVQTLSELSVYCVTFSVPPVSGVGKVDADGKFKVSLEGAKGQQFGCFVMKEDDVVATLVFKDSAEKNMDGSEKQVSRAAFEADANFGAIILDLEKGTAVADLKEVEAVRNVVASSGVEFDPTGSWTIQPVDFPLPKGYSAPCPAGNQEIKCGGPSVGEHVFLKRLDGFKVANGVTTGERRYGLMVWGSEESFEACGSKLGFSYEDAKIHGAIDLSLSGVAEGSFNFPAELEDGWKDVANAKSQYEMRDCGPVEVVIDGKPRMGWKCVDSGNAYQIGLGGGCVNSDTNEPLKLYDWAGLNNHESTDIGGGYHRHVNSGTKTINGVLTNVRCESINGEFTAAGQACNYGDPGCFDWSAVALIAAQNQLCSAINTGSAKGQLAQLQCYANHYWQHLENGEGCLRSIETNFSATNPADFLLDGGPQKARAQHLIELLNYASPNEGTVREQKETVRGIPSANGEHINCRVFQTMTITFKKVTDSKILVEFMEDQKNLSLDKAACVAEFGSRSHKGLFYMVK